MRIVSYNILDGGEGRADPLAEVIEAQRPELVALVEAEFPPVVDRIARRLDMDVITGEGNTKASALLSRYPIVSSINHAPMHPVLTKSCLEATVQTPRGPLVVGVVHLHHGATLADERTRVEEVRQILDIFAPHRAAHRPHLLAGDFNANSPIQAIDPNQLKPSSREAWDANGGMMPRDAVQMLLDAGYIDTLHQTRGAAAERMTSFTTQHPGQRVDYIFAHGLAPSKLKSAWIETDRLARYASDHYPVGLEFEM